MMRFGPQVVMAAGLLVANGAVAQVPGVAVPTPLGAEGNLGSTLSQNWSGYAATGTTFSDVVGSWVQPSAACTGAQQVLFWVGLDGYLPGNNHVEQVGTGCGPGKKAGYGWWEMAPKRQRTLPKSDVVSPGDAIRAEVSLSGNQFTLSLTNVSRGWH
jgi:hypothetical protein